LSWQSGNNLLASKFESATMSYRCGNFNCRWMRFQSSASRVEHFFDTIPFRGTLVFSSGPILSRISSRRFPSGAHFGNASLFLCLLFFHSLPKIKIFIFLSGEKLALLMVNRAFLWWKSGLLSKITQRSKMGKTLDFVGDRVDRGRSAYCES
jgi:hypothetical protein